MIPIKIRVPCKQRWGSSKKQQLLPRPPPLEFRRIWNSSNIPISSFIFHAFISQYTSDTKPILKFGMRLELFFKTPEDVLPVINFLTSSPSFIKSFNIPNKNKNDPLLEVIDIIQKQDPSNDIACHYSLKYNSSRDPKDALKKFECFLHQGCCIVDSIFVQEVQLY